MSSKEYLYHQVASEDRDSQQDDPQIDPQPTEEPLDGPAFTECETFLGMSRRTWGITINIILGILGFGTPFLAFPLMLLYRLQKCGETCFNLGSAITIGLTAIVISVSIKMRHEQIRKALGAPFSQYREICLQVLGTYFLGLIVVYAPLIYKRHAVERGTAE